MTEKKEFRGIIRVADKDIKGEIVLSKALTQVRGIGVNLASAVAEIAAKELKIDKNEKIGNLTDNQIKKLEDILRNPMNYGIPNWMVNKKRSGKKGEDAHLISSDLDFQKKQDIKGKIDIKSYEGVRHMFGLAVRGQKTRTMGRKGGAVGVQKKKQKPAKKKAGKK